MLELKVKNIVPFQQAMDDDFAQSIHCNDLEEKVRLLIFRDLLRLNWKVKYNNDIVQVTPPEYYDKETIRQSMSFKRLEIINQNRKWIDKHINLAKENLASGLNVLTSKIKPIIEICTTQKQHDLFRILRYYWSSPYSEYVGRRIKLIIRDEALPNKPVIGIAALGSPIIHIPERDEWIGWDLKTRTENLNYAMDAYVIGALPPYNYLLGGKLVSYILASKEVRKIYENKYKDKISIISGKKRNELVALFTTSLFGKSSQYNRLKYQDNLLYQSIGETKGFGTLHLTKETFNAMQDFLKVQNIDISNRFGSGPSWTMRVIRKTGKLLNFDPYFLLRHSFKRSIYYIPLAENTLDFLNGKTKKIKYYNYTTKELVAYWKERWFEKRKQNIEILQKVVKFEPNDFKI